MQSLAADPSRYLQSFERRLANSPEHQLTKEFIHTTLKNILVNIGEGEPTLNVIGLGSGAGELDLEILKVLHETSSARVENEIVEPSNDMINKYKVIVKMPGLDYVTFRWNKMTATEFENEWKKRNSGKMIHFISMIEMLYYVEDLFATLSFYQSLLHKDGKVLIILHPGESAWMRFRNAFKDQLITDIINNNITSGDIKSFLDSKKIPYQNYKFQSPVDIKCFTPGDEEGELFLDLLTMVIDFRKTAPPELKDGVLEFLKHPDNSQEVNSRILLDCSFEAVVIGA